LRSGVVEHRSDWAQERLTLGIPAPCQKCFEIDIGHSTACRDVRFAGPRLESDWRQRKEARLTIASVGFPEPRTWLDRSGVLLVLDGASHDLIGFVGKLDGPHPQLLDQPWFDRGP
jgi:hypothetical protein